MSERRHGEPAEPIDWAVWLGDDPHVALVNGDMRAWLEYEAQRCQCEALCTCDEQERG